MWRPYYVSPGASAFEAALTGGQSLAPAEALANFVAQLADALRLDGARPSDSGRARLLAAVAAERRAVPNRALVSVPLAGAPLGRRIPGGALAVATIASGSLLLAGAATQTEAVTAVRSAISEFPGLGGLAPGEAPSPQGAVTIEGRISGLSAQGFALDTADQLVDVLTGEETRYRFADGSGAGREALSIDARVRIRGVRDGERLRAHTVQLLPDAPRPVMSTPSSAPEGHPRTAEPASTPAPDAVASATLGTVVPTKDAAQAPPTSVPGRATPDRPTTEPSAVFVSPTAVPTRETAKPTVDTTRTPKATLTAESTRSVTPAPTLATATATAAVEPPRTATPKPVPPDADPVVTATATSAPKATATAQPAPDTEVAPQPVEDPDIPDGIGAGTLPRTALKRPA